jgi:single-stranded DNA-binding protein
MNQVALVGNITDDPELRYTPERVALAGFTVAVSHRSKHNREWQDVNDGVLPLHGMARGRRERSEVPQGVDAGVRCRQTRPAAVDRTTTGISARSVPSDWWPQAAEGIRISFSFRQTASQPVGDRRRWERQA